MSAPYFLVALPQMHDEYFSRAVVLLAHHDETGAFGLIMNRPMKDEDNEPTQMTAEIKDVAGNTLFISSENLFGGGPVGNESIFALHEIEAVGNEESSIGGQLYLGTEPEVFQKLLEHEAYKPKRRFFMGFSSWTAGQLESELRGGSWIAVPYSREYVFENVPREDRQWPEHFWRKILLQSGVDPLTVLPQGNSDSGYN